MAYTDAAVLLITLFVFRNELLIADSFWLAINLLLLTWYFVVIRKAVREKKLVVTPEDRVSAKVELSQRVRRGLLLIMASGVGFTVLGFSHPLVFILAGIMFACALGGLFAVKVVR